MAELLNFRNKILDRLKEEKEKKQAVSVANTTPQLPSGMQKTLNIINKAVEKAKSNQDIFKAETPKLQTDNIFTPKTPQFTTTTTEPKTNTLPTNSLDNNGGGSIWKPINQRINNFTNKAKELKLQNEANDQLKAQEQEWQTAIVKQQLNEENPWRTQKVSDAIKDHWDGTYGDYIDELVSYSGDEKADITESIDNEIIRLKNSEEAKNNNPETMKRLQGFVELRNVIDEKSGTRTKSFGRQFSDWLTTGGFLGDIGVNNLRKALGVITGNEDKVDSLLEQQQVKRQGLGGVGVVNDILAGGANLAMNATMAGIPALFSAGAGAIGAVADTDDKVLDYDENGNAIMRDKTTKENAAGLGQAGLGLAFAGFGRSKLGQKFMPSFDATKGLGLKEIVKYGAKELPFAFGVTAAEQGFQNLSQNKDFLDYNPEDFAKAYALNLGQDVGMDLFNYGRDKKTISDANAANRQIYQNALENATTRQIEGNNGKIEAAIMNEQPSSKQNISSKIKDTVDVAYTKHVNRNAEKRLEKALTESMNGGTKGNTKFVRLSKQTIEDANAIRKSQGIEPLTSRQVVAYQNAINNNLNNRIKEGMSVSDVVKIAYNSLTSPNTEALPGKGNNTLMVSPYNDRYNGSVIGDFDGTTSLKSIEPRHKSQVESLRTTKNNLLGRNGSPLTANQEGSVTQTSSKTNIYEGSTSLGRRDASVATEPPRTLNSSISQTGDNVNTTSKIPVSGGDDSENVRVKFNKIVSGKTDASEVAKIRKSETFRPSELLTDAKTFQYKENSDINGVTDRLKGVKAFDPLYAGKIIVYEALDGKKYVVDGHQRLGLAKRLDDGNIRLEGFVFKEADGYTRKEMRLLAAQKNIAEGSGTAIDTAKIIREIGSENLPKTIPTNSVMVKNGLSLAKLGDTAFQKVVNGDIEANEAAIVADVLKGNEAKQIAAIDYIRNAKNDKGRKLENLNQVGIFCNEVKMAETRTTTQTDLFGTYDILETVATEKIQIVDKAMRELQKDKKIFNGLLRNETKIKSEGKNKLDKQTNARIAQDADTAIDLIQKLASKSGVISDKANNLASLVKDEKITLPEATKEFKDFVMRKDTLDEVFGKKPKQSTPAQKTTQPTTQKQPETTTYTDGSFASRGETKATITERFLNSNNSIIRSVGELMAGRKNKTIVGKINNNETAKMYSEEAGIQINNRTAITLTEGAVRHIDDSGHFENKRPSSVKLTEADFLKINDIINNPDSIENRGPAKRGTRLAIEKTIDNNHKIIVDALHKDGQMYVNKMDIVTFFNKDKKNGTFGTKDSVQTDAQKSSLASTGKVDVSKTPTHNALDVPQANKSIIPQTTDLVNTTSKIKSEIQSKIPVSGDSEAQAVDVKLTKNTSDIDNYIKQQAAAQKAQSKKSLKDRLTDTYYDLKHYLVDDAVAHERYIKDADERMNIREGVDRVRGSDTIARQMIEDSGLAETIGKMKNAELEEFSQYLIAKRGQELKRTKGEDFKTGRDDAKDIALINRVGDKYKKQEQVVRDFNKSQLDYAVETGLISKELRNKLLKDNTDYVPMNRVLDDIAESGLHKSKQLGSVSKQHAVQKIEGSDKVVKNPLESMIQNAIRTVNEGERNKVAKMLTDSAVFNERRVVEGYKPKAGEDTISLFVNGKKQRYAVPELVAKEMKNLNNVMPDFANKAIKVFSAPAKALRAGATSSNPVFTISNFVRDQIQTVFTGNLKTNIKGFNDAFSATFLTKTKDGKAKRAELAKNGVVGTEYRQTYGYKSGELVKELQANYQLPKTAWEKLKHPIDTIADVIGKTEYFTRAQQYYGTKNSGGTDTQAAQAARNNTVNFSRGGSAVRVINKIVPFLNAGVQGGRITVNQFKERPVRTTIAMGTLVGVAAAIRGVNTSQNSDLWDRLGDEEKKNNLVVFTDDAHYNPETNRVEGIVKIPMPQMLYPVLDAVNNVKGEAEDFIKLGGDVITAISGVEVENPINQLLPTAVKPFIENAMNKDTFTGREIVSEYDSNLDPEDKGKKYSSGLARKLAEITGIDAPKIDNFIADWGGGMAKDIVKVLSNNPDNDKDGGGILSIVPSGINRRFMSGSVESQYNIQATLAEGYKKELKQDPAFQALSEDDKQKALNRIDTDTRAIAGYATREEREQEQTTKLTSRQKDLRENGFKVENYNTSSGKVENAQGDWYIVEEGKIKRNDGQSARYTGDAMALLGNDEALNMLAMTQSEYERDQEANRWGAVNNSDKAMVDVYKSELDKVKQGYNDGTKSRQDVEAAEKKLKDTEERVKINEVNKLFHEEGGIDAYELEKLYKNTSLTEWREMATSDPETYEKLAVYDEYRTNAGVSGKNGNKNANKYYQKNSGGSSKKSSGGTSAKAQAGYNAYLEALKNGGGKMTQTKGSMPTASESSGGGMRASIRKATLGAEAKASTKKGEA